MYLSCLKRLTDNTNQHLFLQITYALKTKKNHKQGNSREINARLLNNHNNNSKNSNINICPNLCGPKSQAQLCRLYNKGYIFPDTNRTLLCALIKSAASQELR